MTGPNAGLHWKFLSDRAAWRIRIEPFGSIAGAIIRVITFMSVLTACSAGSDYSAQPPSGAGGRVDDVSEQNHKALQTFGQVFEKMTFYMPEVKPNKWMIRSLDAIGTDTRLRNPADEEIIRSAIVEIEGTPTSNPIDLFRPFGQAVEGLSKPPNHPTITTLVELGLGGMTSGLDAHTRYIPQCDSDDAPVRLARIGKLGLQGHGLSGVVVICPRRKGERASPASTIAVQASGSLPGAVLRDRWIYIPIGTIVAGEDVALRQTFDRLRIAKNSAARGIIIDLRSSDGGLLSASVKIAALFLASGTPIAHISATAPANDQQLSADNADMTGGLPIVVLVSGRTAAGAEIIAGALQDNHRAVLVGTITHGSGSIQTVFPNLTIGRLILTTGYVMLPAGRPLQNFGIRPDIALSQSDVKRVSLWATQPLSKLPPTLVGIVPAPVADLNPSQSNSRAVKIAIQILEKLTSPINP